MKLIKTLKFYIALIILIGAFNSCSKKEDNREPEPEFNEQGLQIGIPPIVSDTIVRNSKMSIKVLNNTSEEINLSKIYELELEGANFSRVKKGTTIIDNIGGRLWVVIDVSDTSKNSIKEKSSFGGIKKVKAFIGRLGNIYQNAIVKISYNENRAKNNSQYPYKLKSNQVTLNAFNEDFLWYIKNDNVSTKIAQLPNGANISTDEKGNIIIGLSNLKLIESGGTSLKIVDGSITLKGAVDAEMRYSPKKSILNLVNPLSINGGSIKDFKSAIYLSADFDVTLGGKVEIVDYKSETPLTNYIIVVPVGCCAFIELELDVALKTILKADANFNISPRFISKNDFIATSAYQGLQSLPNLDFKFKNVENSVETNGSYNVNSNLRLEIIPKASVYLYGILGPSAKLIPYINLDAGLNIDDVDNKATWDAKIDYGVDTKLGLDINVLGETSWIENSQTGIQEIFELFNENIYKNNLYTAPNSAEIVLGNNQTGKANSKLETPIEIRVIDNLGNGLPYTPVFFETTTNNGDFGSKIVTTDADGRVVNYWTLGSLVGSQTATAYVKNGKGEILESTKLAITATAGEGAVVESAKKPSPTHESINVVLDGSLSFTAGANTPSDATYKLYFDTNPSPVVENKLNAGQTSISYNSLLENTKYYWKVETINDANEVIATSTVWSFTTEKSTGSNTFPGQTISVAGGTFSMGSNNGSGIEQPIHTVTLNDFNISKHEITNQQFVDYMNVINADANGSVSGDKYLDMENSDIQINYTNGQFVVATGKENHPVTLVTWYGAKGYSNYYGGRLPTEAEWEFVARGGNASNGYTYSGSNNIDDVAWYDNNSGASTHAVGTKKANELGVYDMTGNAVEWINDWYSTSYYSSSPVNNPQGPTSANFRGLRGGGWDMNAYNCRITLRSGYYPTYTSNYLGFRPVFTP